MNYTTDGLPPQTPSQALEDRLRPRKPPSPDELFDFHSSTFESSVTPTNSPVSYEYPTVANGDPHEDGSNEPGDVAALEALLDSSASTDPLSTNRRGPHVQQIVNWLRLFVAEDQVVELRALGVVTRNYRKPHVVSGYFDFEHLEEMAKQAWELSPDARGMYFTLNPLNRDLLFRRYNRIDDAQVEMATYKDVLHYRWLLIDIDPQRVSGISATNDEKATALEKIQQIRKYLREHHWPAPIIADSGNGYHLLYRIELPVQESDLVKRVLHALAEKFDEEYVKVDRSVFNPSRITKLYGTWARKGDNSPERPHRPTSILDVPESLQSVPRTHLEALAATVPSSRFSTADKTKQACSAQPLRDRGSVQDRARAYLDKLPPAISGQHGHDRAFHAACALILGFDLTVEEALLLLQQYNEKCQPPWTDEELLHKLRDADKKEGARGYLLGHKQTIADTAGSSVFQPVFMDSTTLQQSVRKPRWLVKKIVVAGQPAVIGGPKKALKTSLVIDLAISLGSGKLFLHKFPVAKPVKVLVLSGESGPAAILDTAQRVCRAKNIALSTCGVLWGFELPRLASEMDLTVLTTALVANSVDVVIIDPLYVCLLAGNAEGRQASNLFDMGPLLLQVAKSCLEAGTTPILVHHARKQNQAPKGRNGEPLDLEDLAYSGMAEFARQWLLISRREKFDPELGKHELWLSVGGSAGHSGLYALDVQEGVMNDDFGGRQWYVKVDTASKAIQARNRDKDAKKQQAKAEAEAKEKEMVLSVLNLSEEGQTTPDIAAETGLSKDKTGKLLQRMLKAGTVVRTMVPKAFGSGERKQPGWKKCPQDGQTFTHEQIEKLRNGVPIEEVLGAGPKEANDDTGSVEAEA